MKIIDPSIFFMHSYPPMKDVKQSDPEICDEIKTKLIEKYDMTINSCDTATCSSVLTNTIKKMISSDTTKKQWIECENECSKIINPIIYGETNTTWYMLKVLYYSIIYADSKSKPNLFIMSYNKDKLTGLWKNDKQYLDVVSYNNDNFEEVKKKFSGGNIRNPSELEGKLIFGFGPSASGKTYWAKKLIELFNNDKKFPEYFISIDGGIMREMSVIYQNIVKNITNQKIKPIHGISNLSIESIKATIKSLFNPNYKLFNSSKIKSLFCDYLKIQSANHIAYNIYVPDTLSFCLINCVSKVSKYKKIANTDKCIGLYIYQHKEGKMCTFKDYKNGAYACIGCTESGKKREKTEGKIYTNSNYASSQVNGLKTLGICDEQYIIHNSGNTNLSILFDITGRLPEKVNNTEELNNNNITYVSTEFIKNKYKDFSEKPINLLELEKVFIENY
jgi:hypothetical protein